MKFMNRNLLIPGMLAICSIALLAQTSIDNPKPGKPVTGFVGPIEELTLKNEFFRQVLFTGEFSQLAVMCLQPGEEIGNEIHPGIDQFFRIEQGEAKFIFNDKEEYIVKNADAVIVPSGTKHNIINVSKTTTLKLYTLYSSPNHPIGTIDKTKADAAAHEHH